MIAVGALIKAARSGYNFGDGSADQITIWDRITDYFGAAYIPDEILDWAAGTTSLTPYNDFVKACQGDAMSHHNKGVVGVYLAYQEAPRLSRVKVNNMENHGGPPENTAICNPNTPDHIYKGNDVRAMAMVNTLTLSEEEISGLHAGWNGKIITHENFHTL
jgi:hypothetical protein